MLSTALHQQLGIAHPSFHGSCAVKSHSSSLLIRNQLSLHSPSQLQRWEKIQRSGRIQSESSEQAKIPLRSWVQCDRLNGTWVSRVAVNEVENQIADEVAVTSRKLKVAVAAMVTIFFAVANRVLYKLALVPLKQYPFFLAQITTFGYVAVYFSILYLRYRAGIVTNEMLALPKFPFLGVGVLEALGAVSGMAAATMLPGASIPILSQTFLVWQLVLSVIFLKRQYSANQICGCLLISAGVIIAVASGAGAGKSLQQAGIFWPLLMITSFLFQAADTILKEFLFLDAEKKLKGGSLDLFVINSFGSGFQALCVLLLLPFLSRLWGIPFYQLPSYIKDGTACFVNLGSLSVGCQGAPLLPLLFIFFNMAFNISLLYLLKVSSAVVSSLAVTFSVPLSIYMFTFPLPYIGAGTSLPPGFLMGVAVLVTGLSLYNFPPSNADDLAYGEKTTQVN